MRPGESDELLSAYLDREVTPAERERVESQLDASPDTRAELDALAELSLCLRTMDRPEAPPDLKAGIMHALASRRIEAVPAKPLPPRWRREWSVMSIAAIATTACGLYIAVTGWEAQQTDHAVALNYKMADDVHPTMPTSLNRTASRRDRPQPLVASDLDSLRTSSTFSREAGEFQPRSEIEGLPKSGPIAPPTPGTAVMLAETKLGGTSPAAEKSSWTDANALDKVAINDVLNAWASTDAPDRYVANIDLYVHDVRRTADGFQVLLLKNGVEKGPGDESGTADAQGSGKKLTGDAVQAKPGTGGSQTDESMIAVYVDTTADRVTKSLEALSQNYEVVGVRVQPPLALARQVEDALAEANADRKIEEKLQQRLTTVDEVAQEFVIFRQNSATEFFNENGPADALAVVDMESRSRRSQMEATPDDAPAGSQLAKEKSVPMMRAAKVAEVQKRNNPDLLKDSNNALSLNYCSELRLPLVSNSELADFGTQNSKGLAPLGLQPNRMLLQNSPTSNSLSGNSLVNQTGNSYGNRYPQRARQADGLGEAPSVRVLVVFQGVTPALKTKGEP